MLKWADSETPKAANRSKQSKQCPWGQRHFYFNWLKNADSKGHFRLLYYHGLGSESKKTMNKPSLLFCLHNKFCLSHFLIKKKKKWCIDCIHLHLPSKVFHLSFCHLVNGVYPNCLGAPSHPHFAVGFTGGAQQLSPQSSFCPLTGTICCSDLVLNKPWMLKENPVSFYRLWPFINGVAVFLMILILKNYDR